VKWWCVEGEAVPCWSRRQFTTCYSLLELVACRAKFLTSAAHLAIPYHAAFARRGEDRGAERVEANELVARHLGCGRIARSGLPPPALFVCSSLSCWARFPFSYSGCLSRLASLALVHARSRSTASAGGGRGVEARHVDAPRRWPAEPAPPRCSGLALLPSSRIPCLVTHVASPSVFGTFLAADVDDFSGSSFWIIFA